MCAVYRDVVQAVLTIMGYHGVGYYILYYCVFFSSLLLRSARELYMALKSDIETAILDGHFSVDQVSSKQVSNLFVEFE